jgi:hypothetical protein
VIGSIRYAKSRPGGGAPVKIRLARPPPPPRPRSERAK